jgi:hypothetical protein
MLAMAFRKPPPPSKAASSSINLAKPQNHDGCRDIGPTLEPEWLRTLRLLLVLLLLLLLLLLVLLFVFYCRVLNEVPHMGYSTGLPA